MDTPNLIDTVQAARLLGVSRSWLEHARSRDALRIPYIRLGGSVRYDPTALRAWALARMVNPPTPAGAQPEPQAQPEPPRRRGRPRKAA